MKDYVYILIRNTLAGLNSPILKVLTDKFPIYSLLVVRQLILFLTSIFTTNLKDTFEEMKTLKKEIYFRLFTSVFFSSAGVYVIFVALGHVPISLFSLMEQSLVMIVSILFGFIFLKERLSKKIYVTIFIMFIGLILVITKGDFTSFDSIPLFGTFLLFLHALFGSISGVFSVKVINNTTTSTYMFMSVLCRLLLFVPLPYIFGETIKEFADVLTIGLGLLVIYAGLSIFIIEYMFSKSIKTIGYTKSQIFIPLIPAVSTIVSMVMFQQWFNFYQYIGLFIIFGCIYYIIKNK